MRLVRLLKRDLARESSTWVALGVISEEQAVAICSHYGIDYHDLQSRSFGYHILTTLGYLFVGLSIITLVGANWDEIPRVLRMSALILVTLGFNSLGLYRYRQGSVSGAVGFFFLGGLCYGASIMLIAQIYHIGEHFPDGIFWWAMGVLPAALLLESTVLMMLTAFLAFIWFFVEAALHFYPLFFLVFTAAMAWHVFRCRQSNTLFLALVFGAGTMAEYTLSWHLGDGRFNVGPENVLACAALFLLFFGISQWMSARSEHRLKDYGLLLEVWVLRFTIITLFVFSFEEPWEAMIGASWIAIGLIVTLSIILAAAALGLATVARRGVMPLAALSAWYFIALWAVTNLNRADVVFLQVADNIVLIVVGVWLIVAGIRRGTTHHFYLGILTIMTTALLRYIDLVGDYIGAACLFAFFAVILLATARYWKRHLGDTGVAQ